MSDFPEGLSGQPDLSGFPNTGSGFGVVLLAAETMAPNSISAGGMIGGRYRLERLLGEGGMGRVWSATHVVTRRAVAIKFLKEAVQHKSDVKQRFLREATAASALRHPNVVEVIDVFDLDDQSPVMVMELLEGETLGAKLAREERLSAEETVRADDPGRRRGFRCALARDRAP